MNYQRLYDNIINAAKCKSYDLYTEKHHIIPKCLGGSNVKDNLVVLSYREHFLCHWILCKIYPNDVYLKFAFAKMLQSPSQMNRKVNSWRFDIAKRYVKNQVNNTSFKKGNVPWNVGGDSGQIPWNKGLCTGPMPTEERAKRSEKLKEYWSDKEHHRKGKSPWCAGTKGTGLVKAWNKGLKAEIIICPHCGKTANAGNFTRWHGDNCKALKNVG